MSEVLLENIIKRSLSSLYVLRSLRDGGLNLMIVLTFHQINPKVGIYTIHSVYLPPYVNPQKKMTEFDTCSFNLTGFCYAWEFMGD